MRVKKVKAGPLMADVYPSELVVWRGIRQGLGNKAIARQLGFGVGTVENLINSLYSKMGLVRTWETGPSGRRVLLGCLYPLDDIHEPITRGMSQ